MHPSGLRPSLSKITALHCIYRAAFNDAMALQYGWPPANLPSKCDCGNNNTVDHALSCPKGGFPSIRHNEIRDLTANLLTEVCSGVCIEPPLQPTTADQATANSQDGARLDVSANGVWGGRFQKTYFDVRVFNPHAPSNRNQTPSACYRKHEREKKRAYDQRIREVEHSSFSPLVFSATGGMGRKATCFYKRLASMLAHMWDQPYSTTLWWLRCRLTFSLICSAIQALRGARSSQGNAVHPPASIDLVITESCIVSDQSLCSIGLSVFLYLYTWYDFYFSTFSSLTGLTETLTQYTSPRHVAYEVQILYRRNTRNDGNLRLALHGRISHVRRLHD